MLRPPASPAARLGVLALLACCAAFSGPVRADLVYVVSKTTGGLYRFDSSNPAVVTTVFGTNTFNQPTSLALGPDGHLYIGESPEPGDGDPRILRHVIGSGTFTEAVSLSGTTPADAVYPAAITFRRTMDGGEMLVGRNPASSNPYGPVMAVTGWQSSSPTVAPFTSGSLNASPGLAVSPETGLLYVSDAVYLGDNQPILGTIAVFSGSSNPAPYVESYTTVGPYSGPIGLVVSGSTLYSANAVTNQIMATDLLGSGSSWQVAQAPFVPGPQGPVPFEVGTLAQLSDGDLLAGSLLAFSGQIFRISISGSSATPLFGTNSGFGQIGGLVTIAVPEPAAVALAAAGLVAVVGWRRRWRRKGA